MTRPLLVLLLAAATMVPAAALAQQGPRPGSRCADMTELFNSEGRLAQLQTQRQSLQSAQASQQAAERAFRSGGQPGVAEAHRGVGQGLGQALSAVEARIRAEQAEQARIRAKWNLSCAPAQTAPQAIAMGPGPRPLNLARPMVGYAPLTAGARTAPAYMPR